MGRVCKDCVRRGLLLVAPVRLATSPAPREPEFKDALLALWNLRGSLVATGAPDLKVEGIDAALAILKSKRVDP